MARVVRRNERDIHETDHDKRAELPRAETEEVELLAAVGFVSVGGGPGKHTSVLTQRRSCQRPFPCVALRKTHVLFNVQDKNQILKKKFELETKSSKTKFKNHRTITRRSGTLLEQLKLTKFSFDFPLFSSEISFGFQHDLQNKKNWKL